MDSVDRTPDELSLLWRNYDSQKKGHQLYLRKDADGKLSFEVKEEAHVFGHWSKYRIRENLEALKGHISGHSQYEAKFNEFVNAVADQRYRKRWYHCISFFKERNDRQRDEFINSFKLEDQVERVASTILLSKRPLPLEIPSGQQGFILPITDESDVINALRPLPEESIEDHVDSSGISGVTEEGEALGGVSDDYQDKEISKKRNELDKMYEKLEEFSEVLEVAPNLQKKIVDLKTRLKSPHNQDLEALKKEYAELENEILKKE